MFIRRLLFIVALLALMAWLAVLAVSFIDRRDLHKIELVSYPSDAKVSINGSPYSSTKVYYLEPGIYTATFSRDGFSTENVRIDTNTDRKFPVLASLLAVSDEANQWEEANKSERESFERLSSSILNEQGQDRREENPIVKFLPSKTSLYSIGYITNDDQSITVTIHAPDVYVPYAINQIERWGIDPEDYDIEFVNQRNIFTDE